MKRSELVVGAELYRVQSYGPNGAPWGAAKATVLAVEPHAKRSGFGWGSANRIYKTPKGVGVLVRLNDETHESVVALGQLKGDWAKCKAQADLDAIERDKAAAVERQKQAAKKDVEAALIGRLAAHQARIGRSTAVRGGGVEITREAAALFADLLDEA